MSGLTIPLAHKSALADARASLLHAEDEANAIDAVVSFLSETVGHTEVLSADLPLEERTREVTLETAPSEVRGWMTARGSRNAMIVPVRSTRPKTAVVDLERAVDAALVHVIAADLDRVLELRTALVDNTKLARALAEKDRLLHHTTDALFRDAGEVVRVLGELERRDASIKEELHRVLRFQRAMLAPLPKHHRLSLDAIYLAADVISADFYDVAVLDSDHVRIFVADATGHGIAAGLVTMFVKAEYEAQKRVCTSPSSLVASMNDGLTSRYDTLDLRCTAICIDVHPERGAMRFTSAAHPGPAVMRSSRMDLLPGGNTFLGVQAGAPFDMVETTLEHGDLVVAFTDGLLDASAPNGARFGRTNFEALVREARSAPESFASLVVNGLSSFVGEHALLDDVTAVALSLRQPT